jgi:hypothetical protein
MRYQEIIEAKRAHLHEGVQMVKLYHGTSRENAEYIEKHGFGTDRRVGGISKDGQMETRYFTCLTPSKQTAKWYAWNGSGKDGVVMTVSYPINPIDAGEWKGVRGWMDIFQAFAVVGDKLGVPRVGERKTLLSMKAIAEAALAKGFNAITFKDTWSDGRSAVVALDPHKISYGTVIPIDQMEIG